MTTKEREKIMPEKKLEEVQVLRVLKVRRMRPEVKAYRERRRKRRIIQAYCSQIVDIALIVAFIGIVILLINVVGTHSSTVRARSLSCIPIAVSNAPVEMEIKFTTQFAEEPTTHEEIACEEEMTEEVIVEEEVVPCISADGPSSVYYYDLDAEEKMYIAKVIYKEARGEIFEGQVAVAAVILNRYYSDDLFFEKDSIYSVITQPYQFAPIDDVTIEKLEKYPSCMEAVEQACLGWDPTRETFPQGALYFFDPENVEGRQKEIREGIKIMVIGNHYFHFDFEKASHLIELAE